MISKKGKISRIELGLLEKLWELGPSSIREIQESLPEEQRTAYTTVQTMIYRLEEKGAVRRKKKIGNAHVFEAVSTRAAIYRQLVGNFLEFFGGSPVSLVSHLVETGKLTLADVRTIEKQLQSMETKK